MFVLRCRQFQFKQYNLVWHGRVFVLLFGLVLVGFYTCFFLSLSLLSYFDVWTNTRAIVLRIFLTNTNTSLSTTTYRHIIRPCADVLFVCLVWNIFVWLCVWKVKFDCVLNVCRVFFLLVISFDMIFSAKHMCAATHDTIRYDTAWLLVFWIVWRIKYGTESTDSKYNKIHKETKRYKRWDV